MKLHISFIASAFILFAFAQGASAAEPLIFRMADGQYFHPASGLVRDSPERILRELGLMMEGTTAPSAPVQAAPVPVSAGGVDAAVTASTMKDAVIGARRTLQAQVDAWHASGTTPKRVGTYDTFVDVTLAVWNAKTKTIDYVEVTKNGTRMTIETPAVPYGIRVDRTNGVNSQFGFDDGGERVVVAVKYPVFRRVAGAEGWYDLEPVVYTPWSKRIHTPEIVAWGKETLLQMISDVYSELSRNDVRSLAFPDRKLTDVISPELVQAVSVIEHLGIDSLTGPNAEYVMDSVFVILATNGDSSYAYSRSSMGAKGMAQFIPSTYEIIKRRTELGLDPDFETGMANAHNAIKAMVAYLDAELDYMPLSVQDLFYVDEARVHEYLVAAYNAGGVRVRRAILMWGDTWSEPHTPVTTAQANATLRAETVQYVKKLRAVKTILLKPVISILTSGTPAIAPAAMPGQVRICFSDGCRWITIQSN